MGSEEEYMGVFGERKGKGNDIIIISKNKISQTAQQSTLS